MSVRHSEKSVKFMVAVRGSSFGSVGLGKDGLLVVQAFNLTVIFEEKLLTHRYFSFQASS